jgi:phospholipid/cholesterol/gamma-HCH transport system substrate-binding protein
LAGVVVGEVGRIGLASRENARASVILHIDDQARDRLRSDARALLLTTGLLGDRVIALDPGRGSAPFSGDRPLPGRTPTELTDVMEEALKAVAQVHQLVGDLHAAMDTLDLGALFSELRATSSSLRRFAGQLERGPGLVHALVADPQLARAVRGVAVDVGEAGHHFALAARAASSSAARLDQAGRQVADVVDHVHAGKGTLGGLIYDPAIYENLRTIVGNVQRSVILRSVARFALRHR